MFIAGKVCAEPTKIRYAAYISNQCLLIIHILTSSTRARTIGSKMIHQSDPLMGQPCLIPEEIQISSPLRPPAASWAVLPKYKALTAHTSHSGQHIRSKTFHSQSQATEGKAALISIERSAGHRAPVNSSFMMRASSSMTLSVIS